MVPKALPVAVLISLVAAGCISGGDDPTADDLDTELSVRADWFIDILPSSLSDPNHDHGNRAHHAHLTTENFETIGWDPLITATTDSTLTGMGCGGVADRDDGRRLAVVHSISTVVSFVVADITDPENPEMLGEFYLPNAVVWDATISADGNHVLIGAYPPLPIFGRAITPPAPTETTEVTLQDAAGQDGATDASQVPVWAVGRESMIVYRNSCTGNVVEVGPRNYLPGPAIIMAGIQDPNEPTFEDYVPQPVIGPHSVGSQEVDGTVYATSSVTNLLHEGSYYTFFEITETPAGGRLVPLSVLQTPGIASPALNGHTDVYLHKHPFTDQVLAYLANWDGMYVYDMTNPRVPIQLGVFKDGNAGSLHTTFPFPYVSDDRFYMVAAQEVGEPVDLPSGWVYILDVTDPTQPTEVSRWTLPMKPKWDGGGLQFSPHYVDILDDTMFVTNYHGGMWAVDISDIANPAAIGIFVPHLDSPQGYGGRDTFGPTVGDVIVDQETGIVTTWDNAGGVYQLRFLDEVPAPRAPVWDGEL